MDQKDNVVKAMKTWPKSLPSLKDFKEGAPAQWAEEVVTNGKLSSDSDPYVVDEIPVPFENYDNSWVEDHGHTHVFGTDRDRYGNFYFPAYDEFYKLPPDGSGVKLVAKGFRNCMGVAVNEDGLVLAAPQEGTWTPASMIIEVREGEHYGFKRTDESISPPMCFIPRGVDNSTGGMVFVDSDRWGPLGKSLIGLSYVSGLHYLILRDESVPRPQGATVPLKGEFPSGVVRGRINPKDGQLYVVGTDGWGNYAIQDGCLNRIRYTGKPVHKPIGFQVHSNGIRIDFTEPVDPEAASKPYNYFAQQWNCEHSKGYGSVEYSVFRPHMIGHDRVDVRSVQILNSGKSVFLEIPRIVRVIRCTFGCILPGKTECRSRPTFFRPCFRSAIATNSEVLRLTFPAVRHLSCCAFASTATSFCVATIQS